MYSACEGLSDLGHGDPTSLLKQPLVNTVPHTPYHHGALIFTHVVRARILGSDQNLAKLLDHTSLMSGIFPVCVLACEGLSDSDHGHGPNKPTALC